MDLVLGTKTYVDSEDLQKLEYTEQVIMLSVNEIHTWSGFYTGFFFFFVGGGGIIACGNVLKLGGLGEILKFMTYETASGGF